MKFEISIDIDVEAGDVWASWKRDGVIVEEASFENSARVIAKHLESTLLSEMAKVIIIEKFAELLANNEDDRNTTLAAIVEDVYDLDGLDKPGYEDAIDHVHELYEKHAEEFADRSTSSENLNEDGVACSSCGAQEKAIIGCPDGSEVCQDCFDTGAH